MVVVPGVAWLVSPFAKTSADLSPLWKVRWLFCEASQ